MTVRDKFDHLAISLYVCQSRSRQKLSLIIRVMSSCTLFDSESGVDASAKRAKAAIAEAARAEGRTETRPPSLCDVVTLLLESNSSSYCNEEVPPLRVWPPDLVQSRVAASLLSC